ncbi:MAG: hypothetical protein Kow0092_34230 [Deferrisomatales bacterium]
MSGGRLGGALIWGMVAVVAWPGGSSRAASSPLAARVEAELRLDDALSRGDRLALERMAAEEALPGEVRGRALWALWCGPGAESAAAGRARLSPALGDPAPEVRRAAARAVARRGERALERSVLRLAAEDPDPEVRREALRAVRPWSRQGHLYFLEQALASPWPTVQAEALGNLARLPRGELPPAVGRTVRELAVAGDPRARFRAFDALEAWGWLEWGPVRAALLDRGAPDPLRLRALEAGEALADPEEWRRVLLDLLAAESSRLVAGQAFRRLRQAGPADPDLPGTVARRLSHASQKDAATEAMAAYLRDRGYRVAYRAGAWAVSPP